ncbi:hypothetical protein [Methylocaldum szegediense]|uniref:Uncharacterized protein n=1 Tax=Methylocaldum szegediense TaxID=73780 RepID=A0ABN8X8I6_9GAMM|nr:hypothetical protein [Methylocaldum szegediense]CAI8889506.1 conserved protein of unknown function [Methylocaldum szegediense]
MAQQPGQGQPEQPKKDYFWFYIAGLIIVVIIGVLLLKGREMASVPYEAYEETKKEVEQQLKGEK